MIIEQAFLDGKLHEQIVANEDGTRTVTVYGPTGEVTSETVEPWSSPEPGPPSPEARIAELEAQVVELAALIAGD